MHYSANALVSELGRIAQEEHDVERIELHRLERPEFTMSETARMGVLNVDLFGTAQPDHHDAVPANRVLEAIFK